MNLHDILFAGAGRGSLYDQLLYRKMFSSGEIITTEYAPIASFVTNKAQKALAVSVLLEPIQSGSGTPSPDNVRPISGRTEVETVVSPTTSAEDGTTYTTALGRTVYGGTLDVVSGELVVDRAMVDLGSLTWTRALLTGSIYIFYCDEISDRKGGSQNLLSSAFQTVSGNRSALANVDGGISDYNGANKRVAIRYDAYTSASDFKTAVTGQTLCYELATPQTYQLTPTEVALLLGNNNVWSDGDVSVTYKR